MNSFECKKYSAKKYKGKIRKLVNNQIDQFFNIETSNFELEQHKYKISDDVKLSTDHYLHGIGNNEKIADFIAKHGILSKEATGDFGNHAFQFVVGLWRVKNNILLSDYIKNYSGMVVRYNNFTKQIPYRQLDNFVEDMRTIDHWLWKAESSMEIRFMPSLARDINQIGFILNLESEYGKSLLLNDINGTNFDKKISNYFIKKDLRKNFFNDRNNTFLERASYVIFGINKCFIEGIIVGRNFEKDDNMLEHLKLLFPQSYICSLDGKVIKE